VTRATVAVCVACWNQQHPGRPAPAYARDDSGNVESEPCNFCGKATSAGIFTRVERRTFFSGAQTVPCPRCGKPAVKYPMVMPEGTVDLISCDCVPKEGAPVLDRRLTGFHVPRFVDLDSAEATARIQRVAERFRQRYPDPQNALERAREQAVEIERLREKGFR